VRYTFVKRHHNLLSIKRLCRLLQLSRSSYYTWLTRKPSARQISNQDLDQRIVGIFNEHKGFTGYRRITAYVRAAGMITSINRVRRRMRLLYLKAKQYKAFKRTTDSQHGLRISNNELQQCFQAKHPNQIWVGDISYLKAAGRWYYLATVIDLYARKLVGWAVADHMKSDLVCDAFDMAMQRRNHPKKLVFHSDQGSQYASTQFRLALALRRTKQSMSGKGNCYDNAVAESFFKTFKQECGRSFGSEAELRHKVFEYIEIYYNRKRIHSFNHNLTPENKERVYFQKLAALQPS
jgi:putative transposase